MPTGSKWINRETRKPQGAKGCGPATVVRELLPLSTRFLRGREAGVMNWSQETCLPVLQPSLRGKGWWKML